MENQGFELWAGLRRASALHLISSSAFFSGFAMHRYPGRIGCEYRPCGSTVASLDWMKQPSA